MTEGQPIGRHVILDHDPEINKLFRAAIKVGASDLHLKVNMVPKLRIHGSLKSTTGEKLTEEDSEKLIFEILTENQKQFFLEHGALDFAHQVSTTDRFRVNIFRQRGFISLAARHITSNIPAFETLHMPSIVEKIAENHSGLVLVTGPTGSGKSTTIASMIDHINATRPCHIVTIEDPLEFLHNDKKAIVSQREIGIDVQDFELALKSLMRQDPDVVLVGEIRDNETLTAAMRAAETGHMVFGTLHSVSAAQTIQRILDLFPQEERDLARQTFALTIRAVISQQLLPGIKPEATRIPAIEILIANPIVRKLISEGREADIPSVIKSCQNEGMQDFTESLRVLITEEWIDLKVGLNYATNVEELKMALKGIRSSTSGIL
ncbi:MAG TPA: PilT/PilU family type 4a pilus ATPase [Sedimentisphaerales bacterium]|nr:PilT/PilU family type 4a pilus ATPase [Sedimentisphaerales bacterium]